MDSISFNFYGVRVLLKTPWKDLSSRLKKDFHYFYTEDDKQFIYDIKIEGTQRDYDKNEIPEVKASRQNHNVITFDCGSTRYCDYHGKLLSIYDFENNCAQIITSNLHKAHEVTYLLILSRVGKLLDLNGLHRIHAFGIIYKGTACLGVLPSKGGKSTLLWSLLSNKEIELLSDDTPLIDKWGRIYPFPIRLGREEKFKQLDFVNNNEEYFYELERDFWGKKYLCSTKALRNRIGKKYKRIVLLRGIRSNKKESEIYPLNSFTSFTMLIESCVVGFGLPIIFEYFWENGVEDFFKKIKIALSRMMASIFLILKSNKVNFEMNSEIEKNKNKLLDYLEALP